MKKKYLVKGKVNPLLAEIEEDVWAYSKLQAWKIITLRIHKKFGWHYKLNNERVEITKIADAS